MSTFNRCCPYCISPRSLLPLLEVYLYYTFLDNIDTRSALDALRELVTSCHVFLRCAAPRPAPLLAAAARYVTDVLHVFGAVEGPRGGIGFPVGDADGLGVSLLGSFCSVQYKDLIDLRS